jgi:hypothetical protein
MSLLLERHSPIRLCAFSSPCMCEGYVYLPPDKSPYAYTASLFLWRASKAHTELYTASERNYFQGEKLRR